MDKGVPHFFGGDRDLSFLWFIHLKDVNYSPVIEVVNIQGEEVFIMTYFSKIPCSVSIHLNLFILSVCQPCAL